MIQPILQIRNVYDVCVCIRFINSQIKKLKTYNVKNNSSKCRKFTIKNESKTNGLRVKDKNAVIKIGLVRLAPQHTPKDGTWAAK